MTYQLMQGREVCEDLVTIIVNSGRHKSGVQALSKYSRNPFPFAELVVDNAQ